MLNHRLTPIILTLGLTANLPTCQPANLPAMATNGINIIGFGGESTLMVGADTPIARDTSALNINPAG